MSTSIDCAQSWRDAMRTTVYHSPTAEELGLAVKLAFGSDYITTTSTTVLANRGDWATVKSTYTTTERTIDDIVNEKIEQYKELMRLQALGCKNCGGSINKDSMICDYCGTRYRN